MRVPLLIQKQQKYQKKSRFKFDATYVETNLNGRLWGKNKIHILTQEQVAKELGVFDSTIERYSSIISMDEP